MPVGSLVCPDDFIALHLGLSIFDDDRGHIARRASTPSGAREVLAAWQSSGGELRDGGVYWQTIGPRFETPAEIRLMAAHADLVGMTIASECIVAGELGLAYAAICVVDNLANGIGAGAARASTSSRPPAPPTRCSLHDGLAAVLPRAGRRGAVSARPLTVTGAVLDGEPVGLRCADGRIVALGPGVAAEPGDETIDAGGAPLVAALVNGHTHAAMTLFRGYGGDLPLMRWLQREDLAGRGEARAPTTSTGARGSPASR